MRMLVTAVANGWVLNLVEPNKFNVMLLEKLLDHVNYIIIL